MPESKTDLLLALDDAASDVRDALSTFHRGQSVGMELVADLLGPPVAVCRRCGLELAEVRLSPSLRSPRVLDAAYRHLMRRTRVAISDGLAPVDLGRELHDSPGVSCADRLLALIADQHRMAVVFRDYASLG